MRTFRKDTGGYALLYVMVAVVVVCAVVMAVCSTALDNLAAQRSSVERMQAKYAAQGDVAQLAAAETEEGICEIQLEETPSCEKIIDDAEADGVLNDAIQAFAGEIDDISAEIKDISIEDDHITMQIGIVYESEEDLRITAEGNASLTVSGEVGDPLTKYIYKIKISDFTFTSYEIGGAA